MSTIFSQRGRRDKHHDVLNASTYHRDPILWFERQVKHIQRDLQILIDAQSDGLLAGLSAPGQHGGPSSEDPTLSSEPSSSQKPPNAPIKRSGKRKFGLRAAREGILKSMHDILKLREEQQEIIGAQIGGRNVALMEINKLSSKKTGLEESIAAIQNDSGIRKGAELKEEARNLEADINELETRLYEMKARHRRILDEISQHENAVEAKLSSYKASLSLVESNIRECLRYPPVEPLASVAADTTFYSLNPKRRTLDMAKAHWKNEKVALENKQQEINLEVEALVEGVDVWKQVVTAVSGFERRLKAEMRRFIQTKSQLLQPDTSISEKSKDEQVKAILEDLEHTSSFVAEKLELAEEKDWRLLVCCIGAELEALKEAHGLLSSAFNVPVEDSPVPEREPDNADTRDQHHDDSHTDLHDVDNPEPPADLLRDTNTHSHDAIYRSEDDEPDPAWLLPET